MMENTWGSKVFRTLTCMLPVDSKRKGECIDCGACCKLPNKCLFLKEKKGKSYCSIYHVRPLNCRKYPRTEKEHITKETCGFRFR